MTEGINAEELAEAEKTRYEEYLAAGEVHEGHGDDRTRSPASKIYLNEEHLLEETGEGFGFDVMIHIENQVPRQGLLRRQHGDPIDVPFTTGETHPEPPNTPIHGTLGQL